MKLIDKDTLVAEFNRLIAELVEKGEDTMFEQGRISAFEDAKLFLDTLEVIDPYEHLIQCPSREDGIKAYAEDYSWNIESELFQQLTPEQQKLWRKEIEQACISGGYCGLNLQKDRRYDDIPEVKEIDWEKEWKEFLKDGNIGFKEVAKHFYELGIKAQKGE